jgi:hypothetical protein
VLVPTLRPLDASPSAADRGAEPRSGRLAAWLTLGAAVALAGTAIGCTVVAFRRAGDANDLQDARDATGAPLAYADVATRYRSARDDVTMYRGLAIGFGAGAVLAAGVTTWLFLRGGGRGATERTARVVRLVPGFARGGGLVAIALEH